MRAVSSARPGEPAGLLVPASWGPPAQQALAEQVRWEAAERTAMTVLLLVRHGETEWNQRRLLQGDHDVPLSDVGRAQVRTLAPVVARLRPDHAICSPLSRTRETAALLGHPDAAPDERWQEAHLGRWTGRSSIELRALHPADYLAWRAGRHTPPDGESFDAVADRVAAALDSSLDPGTGQDGTVLVVTHGGPVRAVCRELVGLDPASVVPVAPASLTIFDVNGERPGGGRWTARLRAYNVTGADSTEDPPD